MTRIFDSQGTHVGYAGACGSGMEGCEEGDGFDPVSFKIRL